MLFRTLTSDFSGEFSFSFLCSLHQCPLSKKGYSVEHPLLASGLGAILALIFGFLWHKTRPVSNTVEKTEPLPCSHPKKTSRIFDAQAKDGQSVMVALHLCPECGLVLQPDTPTINQLTPKELQEIRVSLTAEGYDISTLPDPNS